MTNITQEIHNFLNKQPGIVKNLLEGLINVRALSFYILRETNISASIHAVMSAIRRYIKDNQHTIEEKKYVSEVLTDSKISTKSRLLMLKVERHFNSLKIMIPNILNHIDVARGEVLRIIEGRESIKFIIDHSKKDEIIKFIRPEELINIIEDLGEINVHFSEKYGNKPGLVATVVAELAVNDINIIEIFGGMPEFVIIVKENKISECHDILLRFFYNK